jgi:hypothetical protein
VIGVGVGGREKDRACAREPHTHTQRERERERERVCGRTFFLLQLCPTRYRQIFIFHAQGIVHTIAPRQHRLSCMCVRVLRVCVRGCVFVCGWVGVCARVRVCVQKTDVRKVPDKSSLLW